MNDLALISMLQRHRQDFHPLVPFDPAKDKVYPFDFTDKNTALRPEQIADTESFANYINSALREHASRYGIGGYAEHRTLYGRSRHFDTATEPRRLHLGTDIWGPAGTKLMSPLDGIIHSFAFNNRDSDYGATLILTHNLDGMGFHTLYGHLSLNSLKNLQEGQAIRKGDTIGEFGMRFENGNWPPHVHFQLIRDMQDWKGDYPGVCKFSEKEYWLGNSPDPDWVLQLNRYIK
jgi:murein DD-endopeptidase MepM/ murein hydrolase activator NlpD